MIDFRDSTAGRQACIQGSSLAVWKVMLVVRSYNHDLRAAAKHLRWPVGRIQTAVNYAEAFPEEIDQAQVEFNAVEFAALKRILPQAVEFTARRPKKR